MIRLVENYRNSKWLLEEEISKKILSAMDDISFEVFAFVEETDWGFALRTFEELDEKTITSIEECGFTNTDEAPAFDCSFNYIFYA